MNLVNAVEHTSLQQLPNISPDRRSEWLDEAVANLQLYREWRQEERI